MTASWQNLPRQEAVLVRNGAGGQRLTIPQVNCWRVRGSSSDLARSDSCGWSRPRCTWRSYQRFGDRRAVSAIIVSRISAPHPLRSTPIVRSPGISETEAGQGHGGPVFSSPPSGVLFAAEIQLSNEVIGRLFGHQFLETRPCTHKRAPLTPLRRMSG